MISSARPAARADQPGDQRLAHLAAAEEGDPPIGHRRSSVGAPQQVGRRRTTGWQAARRAVASGTGTTRCRTGCTRGPGYPSPRELRLQVPAHTVQHLELHPRPAVLDRVDPAAHALDQRGIVRWRRRSGALARAASRTAARSSRSTSSLRREHDVGRLEVRALDQPHAASLRGSSKTSAPVRRRYDCSATPTRVWRASTRARDLERRVDVAVALHVDHHRRALLGGRVQDRLDVPQALIGIVAALPQPRAVPMIIPSTSPMAQPVRQ